MKINVTIKYYVYIKGVIKFLFDSIQFMKKEVDYDYYITTCCNKLK